MTNVLTISVFFLTLLIVAVLAKRRHFLLSKREENLSDNQLDNQFSVKPASLFQPDAKELTQIEHAQQQRSRAEETERALAWASLVDFSRLAEVKNIANENLRDAAFEILTERARADEDVKALIEFVLRCDQIKANKSLVRAFQLIWERQPDRNSTIKMLRLAAEADDADLFLTVLVETEQFIRSGKLTDLNHSELGDLADSHYWLLGEHARISGAGFLLKQKLFSVNS